MDTDQNVAQLFALLVYSYRISPTQCELLWQGILQALELQASAEDGAEASEWKDGGTQ